MEPIAQTMNDRARRPTQANGECPGGGGWAGAMTGKGWMKSQSRCCVAVAVAAMDDLWRAPRRHLAPK